MACRCRLARRATTTSSSELEELHLARRRFSGAAPSLGKVFPMTAGRVIFADCVYRRVARPVERTIFTFEIIPWKKFGGIGTHAAAVYPASGLFARAAATHFGSDYILKVPADRFRLPVTTPRFGEVFVLKASVSFKYLSAFRRRSAGFST